MSEGFGASAEGPFGSGLSYFCAFGKWPAVLRDCSPCVGGRDPGHFTTQFRILRSASQISCTFMLWYPFLLTYSCSFRAGCNHLHVRTVNAADDVRKSCHGVKMPAWSLLCHARRRMPRSSPDGAHRRIPRSSPDGAHGRMPRSSPDGAHVECSCVRLPWIHQTGLQ